MKKTKSSWAKNTLCGRILNRILGEEKGAVAMEYIVIALLVAAAVVGLVMVFSGNLRNMLGKTNEVMTATKVSDVKETADKYDEARSNMKEPNQTAQEAGDKLGGDFSTERGSQQK